jgi:hypothetical protein
MRWKQFIIIPALMLVLITSVAPINKVVAQGLVEYALILVLVSVGPGEVAEIHWLPEPSQGNPQVPRIAPRERVVFTYVVTNTGDGTCTQTISSPVVANAGLNTLVVSRNEDSLLINREEVEQLKECLRDPNRNAIAVGRPFPPGLSKQMDSDPNAVVFKLKDVRIVSYNIVNSSGATVASGWNEGDWNGDSGFTTTIDPF